MPARMEFNPGRRKIACLGYFQRVRGFFETLKIPTTHSLISARCRSLARSE